MARSHHRIASAAVVAVLVFAAGLVFAPSVGAVWPGGNGKIVFQKSDFAIPSSQIYSMNSQGQQQTNLSAAGGGAGDLDLQPSVSPNGKRIAFTRFDPATGSAQIWVMRIDGSQQTDISNDVVAAMDAKYKLGK